MATKLEWGNPYTHEEHQRICYSRKDLKYRPSHCDWCGQTKQQMYAYDGRKGIFCDKECYKAYYF